MKRTEQLVALAAVGVAVALAVRALKRDDDPLPSVADRPSGPWPPLRDVSAPAGDPAPSSPAAPSPTPPAPTPPSSTPASEPAPTPPVAAGLDVTPTAAPSAQESDRAHEPPAETGPADEADEADEQESDRSAEDASTDGAPDVTDAPSDDAAAITRDDEAGWCDPLPDGSCPIDFPLKGNASSNIFHAPGQMNYDRTIAERCYRDAAAAEADGMRAAKR